MPLDQRIQVGRTGGALRRPSRTSAGARERALLSTVLLPSEPDWDKEKTPEITPEQYARLLTCTKNFCARKGVLFKPGGNLSLRGRVAQMTDTLSELTMIERDYRNPIPGVTLTDREDGRGPLFHLLRPIEWDEGLWSVELRNILGLREAARDLALKTVRGLTEHTFISEVQHTWSFECEKDGIEYQIEDIRYSISHGDSDARYAEDLEYLEEELSGFESYDDPGTPSGSALELLHSFRPLTLEELDAFVPEGPLEERLVAIVRNLWPYISGQANSIPDAFDGEYDDDVIDICAVMHVCWSDADSVSERICESVNSLWNSGYTFSSMYDILEIAPDGTVMKEDAHPVADFIKAYCEFSIFFTESNLKKYDKDTDR